MQQCVSEEILSRRGRIVVVRVLLRMNSIVYRYPRFGVWCYLFRTSDGVVIFDAGPRYLAPLGGPGLWGRESGNTERIMKTLDRYFPGRPVSYIAISHYHFDHVENAPHLQRALKARQGTFPPIRLHESDYGSDKRLFHIFPTSLTRVFSAAGYRSWRLGAPIRDGELLSGTGFRFLHTPGHTSGNIAVVSTRDRLLIGGYWALEEGSVARIIRGVTRFADECPDQLSDTKRKIARFSGYRIYTYHPSPRPFLALHAFARS